jgi:hypothetical protein
MSLAPEELDVLRGLPDELRAVFDAPAEDAGANRLFPPAYLDPDEEEAEEMWEAMVHPDLLRQRLDALELVTGALARATPNKEWREVVLTPEEVQAWLGVLNDTRLVLGTRLGVTEDEAGVDPTGPDAAAYNVYSWLTYLQGELVDALLG